VCLCGCYIILFLSYQWSCSKVVVSSSTLTGTELIPPGACSILNPSAIYANNEVSLEEVDIYGFDYDYTLALYSNNLDTMIYDTARDFLIEHFKVCVEIESLIGLVK
jgi:hypothetical protein